MRNDDVPVVDRDPFIDILRVTCVGIVVVGHWVVATAFWEPGLVDRENALSHIDWLHLATWVVQVMPLLFFVGGFANARALVQRGGWSRYLLDRYGRLLRPTVALFGTWLVVGVVLDLANPVRPNVLIEAAEIAALPVWFLGIYLVVVALAPAMLRLHRRFGVLVPVALAAGTAIVDVLVYPLGLENVGLINYAFVWLFAHQLGFHYADQPELGAGRATGVAAAGLGGVVVLTTLLDYPVSMVGVPGDPRWNTSPPSLALIALTLWLVGVVLLMRRAVGKRRADLLRRANSRVLTWYLWHISALPVATVILLPLEFPQIEIGSATWWAWRPLWVATLAATLALLTTVFGRFEVHPRTSGASGTTPMHAVAAGLAVFAAAVGVLGFGVTGFTDLGSASSLEGFAVSPLQNVANLALGLILLRVVRESWGPAVPMLIAIAYAALGAWVLITDTAPLGANQATAWAYLVVGVVTLGLLATASRR